MPPPSWSSLFANTGDLRKGDRYTVYDCSWTWVPPSGVERGHWLATDTTHIIVEPPSEGVAHWTVLVPMGSDHLRVEVGDNATAFHYASAKRKERAN